jgi:hypothetical protein
MRRRTRSRLRWLTAGAIGAAALACAPSGRAPSRGGRGGGGAEPATTGSAPPNVARPRPGSCHARGSGLFSLPDSRCAPGALDQTVIQKNIGSTICREGFTARERPPESVSEAEKRASLAAYGDAGPLRDYEYDHLVPLELGGAPNDARNLWPEPGASPNPKDALEDELNQLVCRRRMALAHAQRLIAGNWVAAYREYVSPGGSK